jgi:GT2 family glycosyltransferase
VLFFPGAEVFHVVGASHNPALFKELVRGHLRFLRKHRGSRVAERARRVMLWGLRLRGLLFRGDRGRAYRDVARWLGSGRTASLLESSE